MPVVAISADSAEDSRDYAQQQGLTFPLLSDPDASVMDAYGVRMVNTNIAVPATFLISMEGTVIWSHIGETQADFADIPALLLALRETSSPLLK